MAKFIHVPTMNMFTYALDECEDYLLLNAYLRIKESGKFVGAKHLAIFEFYHLQEGGTLNDNILLKLNGSLRQLGRPPLTFVNGHTTSFAGLRGQEKVLRRHAILDRLRALDPAERDELIALKENEAARLPERNADLPARAPGPIGGLSREETERRRIALARAQKEEAGRDIMQSKRAALPETPTGSATAEGEFVPESTIQDNVVELITEMHDLRAEVASLKKILQTVFRAVE